MLRIVCLMILDLMAVATGMTLIEIALLRKEGIFAVWGVAVVVYVLVNAFDRHRRNDE